MQQPVVRDGQLVVGTQMPATLSLDHRVIDGAMAAQYLASLKEFIEEPETLVV
jgi:pyruvate dehydrogenase E2 component (dihydrolipoamide acetyltransferase)